MNTIQQQTKPAMKLKSVSVALLGFANLLLVHLLILITLIGVVSGFSSINPETERQNRQFARLLMKKNCRITFFSCLILLIVAGVAGWALN